jgi:hypothetical protein
LRVSGGYRSRYQEGGEDRRGSVLHGSMMRFSFVPRPRARKQPIDASAA